MNAKHTETQWEVPELPKPVGTYEYIDETPFSKLGNAYSGEQMVTFWNTALARGASQEAGPALLSDTQIRDTWAVCNQPTPENDYTTGFLSFARAIERKIHAGEGVEPPAANGRPLKLEVVGWLCQGKSTQLYIEGKNKPSLMQINGQDEVISIEPRFGAVVNTSTGGEQA